MSFWLFWTIAVLLFAGAVVLFYWGLWGDRAKGRPRCPKCWYDMSGSFTAGKLECPECGHDAQTEKRLTKNRRRWLAIGPSVLLLAIYFTAGLYVISAWYGWQREQEIALMFRQSGGSTTKSYTSPDWLLQQLPGYRQEFHWRITSLRLSKTVTVDEMAYLEELPYLRHLDLAHGNVTDAQMSHLRGLTQLEHLNLAVTKVTDAGLVHLREFPNLKYLNLSGTNVTSAGLAHVRELTLLQELSLVNTKITDEGLVNLQGLTQLNRLYIYRTQVTDAGLVHLKNLTELRFLYMYGTQVTDEGVAELRIALPDCQIVP